MPETLYAPRPADAPEVPVPSMMPRITPNMMAKKKAVSAEKRESRRELNAKFMDKLAANGLLDENFETSEVANRFVPGMLEHVLVGDHRGGAHHLPTLVALDKNGDSTVASRIYDPSIPASREDQLFAARMKQGVLTNGTFRPDVLRIAVDGKTYKKAGIPSFFPNEWSTQQVIENIMAVANTEPVARNEERKNDVHEAVIDDVLVRVIVGIGGKIVTTYPVRGTKRQEA